MITENLPTQENKEFNYSMFSYMVVRLFFDILHGIPRRDVPFVVALEFAILLGYDGQLNPEMKSDMEKELFTSVIQQFKKSRMTKTENALMWLYVKTWGLHGQHVLNEKGLWNFEDEDLEAVLLRITYPRKKKRTERTENLQNLIIQKFENEEEFVKWAKNIHREVNFTFYPLYIRYPPK